MLEQVIKCIDGKVKVSSVQMFLEFRDKSYELNTTSQKFDDICQDDASNKSPSLWSQVDQTDRFQLKVDNITSSDLISIKLQVGSDSEVSDFFSEMRSNTTKNNESKMIAQSDVQVKWLLKNQMKAQKIKMYTVNNKNGQAFTLGSVKIKASFIREQNPNTRMLVT